MRIIIITQDEPFYLPLFFAEIKSLFKKHHITVIILPKTQGLKDCLKFTKQYYNLYGPLLFLKQGFKFVGYKTLGRIIPKEAPRSITSLLKKNKISLLKTKKISDQNTGKRIKKISPDLIISIAAPQILPEGLLNLPRHGCINIHQALLPKYRGINPSFWVLLNQEKETGVSIHFMDKKIDNGPILLQEKVEVSPAETLDSLYLKNIKIGARMLQEAIQLIEQGNYQTIPNPEAKATYFSFPDKKAARRFKKLNKNFF